MKHVKLFNETLAALEFRVKDRSRLVDIERMYGFLLGVTAVMKAIDHAQYWEARSVCNILMTDSVKKRSLKEWHSVNWNMFNSINGLTMIMDRGIGNF